MKIVRTYETFSVRWADGAQWTNFSATEAAEIVAGGCGRGRVGEVERRTFEVELTESLAVIARPGIAERIEA